MVVAACCCAWVQEEVGHRKNSVDGAEQGVPTAAKGLDGWEIVGWLYCSATKGKTESSPDWSNRMPLKPLPPGAKSERSSSVTAASEGAPKKVCCENPPTRSWSLVWLLRDGNGCSLSRRGELLAEPKGLEEAGKMKKE